MSRDLIRKLDSNDLETFKSLLLIYRQEFELEMTNISDEKLLEILKNSRVHIYVVQVNNEIIGGLTMHVLPYYYGQGDLGYIYDVAVIKSHQNQGYGKKLMSHVLECSKNLGMEEVYVEAEIEDLDAIEFYRRTPFSTELGAKHFTYRLK